MTHRGPFQSLTFCDSVKGISSEREVLALGGKHGPDGAEQGKCPRERLSHSLLMFTHRCTNRPGDCPLLPPQAAPCLPAPHNEKPWERRAGEGRLNLPGKRIQTFMPPPGPKKSHLCFLHRATHHAAGMCLSMNLKPCLCRIHRLGETSFVHQKKS